MPNATGRIAPDGRAVKLATCRTGLNYTVVPTTRAGWQGQPRGVWLVHRVTPPWRQVGEYGSLAMVAAAINRASGLTGRPGVRYVETGGGRGHIYPPKQRSRT